MGIKLNNKKTNQPQKLTMNKAIVILLLLALTANIEAIKVLRTNNQKQESKFLDTTEEDQVVLAEVEVSDEDKNHKDLKDDDKVNKDLKDGGRPRKSSTTRRRRR